MMKQEIERLRQLDVRNNYIPGIGSGQWTTVFARKDSESETFSVFCALLDDDAAELAVERDSWDLGIGEGVPSFSGSGLPNPETTYHSTGWERGVRPFVLHRSFEGSFPAYEEITEEFHLLFNLAFDKSRNVLLDFDASGYDGVVAEFKPGLVRVHTRYLKRYLAATRQHLAVFLDVTKFSKIAVETIPESDRDVQVSNSSTRYYCAIRDGNMMGPGIESFSRLCGKVIIHPPPLESCGIWPFEDQQDEDVEFIIDIDDDGVHVLSTSNPDKLSNMFENNLKSPQYLTPVYFRREVLSKYYEDTSRYSVGDGALRCHGRWLVRIDNDLDDYIVVFLGDLGRDLPHAERLHWKQFNIEPQGGISRTNFSRSFAAEPADPEASDLRLRLELVRYNKKWEAKFGWPFFLPLRGDDSHVLETLRVPVTRGQPEFDEQVLFLTKLLVDSLNEKDIVSVIGKGDADEKGISKLERFMSENEYGNTNRDISFLRGLQRLRSAGSGHRKGSRYDEAREAACGANIENDSAMRHLLSHGLELLEGLSVHFLEDKETADA